MPPLKFRAWHKTLKKMYAVCGMHNVVDHHYEEPEREIHSDIQKVSLQDSLPCCEKVGWCDVTDVILMQSTGLLDKSGREMWEGDIYVYQSPRGAKHPHYIFWNASKGRFQMKRPNGEITGILYSQKQWEEARWDYAGNIYENPELLPQVA